MAQYYEYPSLEEEALLIEKKDRQEQIYPVPYKDNQEFRHSAMEPLHQQPREIKQIIHTVCFGDTLQGLSLQYDVSPYKIRNRNNLNSDEIYTRKTLIIPDPNQPITKVDTEDQNEARRKCMIASFRNQMDSSERSDKTALYYLQITEWNINEALRMYKEDLDFERKNPNKQPNSIELIQFKQQLEKKNQRPIELIEKKRQ